MQTSQRQLQRSEPSGSNVKVCLRIKPVSPLSNSSLFLKIDRSHSQKVKVVVGSRKGAKQAEPTKTFSYQEVYDYTASQKEVYQGYKDELLQSVIEGVNFHSDCSIAIA
jgi:hypothetical protein